MPLQSKLNSIIRYAGDGAAKKRKQQLSVFIRDYFRNVPANEIENRKPRSLAALAKSHFQLALSWTRGRRKIRVYNPELKKDGWESKFTIIQIVTANSPFLIDTVVMELNRLGYSINLTIHPLIYVQRDASGKFGNILPFSTDIDSNSPESFIFMEVDKVTDPAVLINIAESVNRVLEDTRLAVSDRFTMNKKLLKMIDELKELPSVINKNEILQAVNFLHWLLENNFIFLGYRNYDLKKVGQVDTLQIVPASGRGILRKKEGKSTSHSFEILPENIKQHARTARLLTITKSNSRSTVHRPANLDYVGILRFNSRGKVMGEHRILGLYTSAAYMSNPHVIPLIREKIDTVMKKSNLLPDSHASKALFNILQTYPRDELFQIETKQLQQNAMGILHLQERQQVRLFARRDLFERFFACIIYIPKEEYHSGIREKIQLILKDALNGTHIDFSASISESSYAQLYLIVHTQPGSVPPHDFKILESRIAEVSRSWIAKLKTALLENYERDDAMVLYARYQNAFPASYMEDHNAEQALLDCRYIDRAWGDRQLTLNLHRQPDQDANQFGLKLFNPGQALPLSKVIPILENMGLFIDSVRPYEIHRKNTDVVWIHSFQMQYASLDILNLAEIKDIFQEALKQVWDGRLENDGFNKLVLCVGLQAREIMILRAYARYMRQLGTSFSDQYLQDTLINNPLTTKLLVTLFLTRFSPKSKNDRQKNSRLKQIHRQIEAGLEAVTSLDEDRILRRYFDLIKATLRSNYYQNHKSGQSKDYLSLKLAPQSIPDLPHPCPVYEIFVYSPKVEGIHLRGGKVARGGLRWSDRREDFRTEVLGLMQAQMVKNAVIVPVGAKGGFYVKQAPTGDRQALMEEGISCYKTFIRGLLDITDNRIGEKISKPKDVVCYDDDDPYLVVAADKGTATFSDIANEISAEYDFWLGDAFASGGSDGYDHKKMGITARGAWESVKHNFQCLDIDIQKTDFTVVGIGDMAGDVFGNGMLLSNHIRLLAAFNHMHIFIDPNPDPESSFNERKRLFELPRSSWEDYDRKLISKGGGIFSRSLKSIQISPEVRQVLQIDVQQTSPDELIRMLLMAPVDLLWNGGIGTYVKADDELDIDVGDKANDNLRINSSQLRCRVIGEGGNLGFTRKARINFSENEGMINADWIDNSGGVDCSDREVNIKILLNKLLLEKEISLTRRNSLLKKMTENVAELVLQDNYRQVRAISVMEVESIIRPGWYALLINELETSQDFSRELEHIPEQLTIDKRKALNLGFSRPETAVLLAHTKTAVYNAIIDTSLPDDPYLANMLIRYFPEQLQKKYKDTIDTHRLRREIVATVLTNSMVNRAGITFAHRLADETGAPIDTVGKAFLAARDVFDIHGLWEEIDKLDYKVSVKAQTYLIFETQHLLRHAARWFIRHDTYLSDLADSVQLFASGIGPVKLLLRRVLDKNDRKIINQRIRSYRNDGVPARIASRFASLRVLIITLELSRLAVESKVNVTILIKLFFAIGSRLKIHTLRYNADSLGTDNVWQDHARVDFMQELNHLQTRLTAMALRYHKSGDDIENVVEKWLKENTNAFAQYIDVYEKMKFTETNELAMLTVVLNKLRNFS